MSGIFLEALIRATETQGQPRRKSDLTRDQKQYGKHPEVSGSFI